MPHIVDSPYVILIARTKIIEENVRNWLTRLQVDGEHQDWLLGRDNDGPPKSDGDVLTELAGRRCYMSFQEQLNPNVKKIRRDFVDYLDNILASKHGSVLSHTWFTFAIENVSRVFCYHPSTEVLTATGWKLVSQIKDGEFILTKNPLSGKARWSVNKKLYRFSYSGNVLFWRNREDHGPIITPEHTLWAESCDLRRNRRLSAREMIDLHAAKHIASSLWGKKFAIDHRINIDATDDSLIIKIGSYEYNAELLLEWLGFVATDGTIVKDETGRSKITINQSKIIQCDRIRYLSKLLFGNRARESGSKYKFFSVSDSHLRLWVIRMIGRTNSTRDLIPLLRYSPRLIKAFLCGAYAGDGVHGTNQHIGVACGYEKIAKDYQALIAVDGLASRVAVINEVGKSHSLSNGNVITATKLSYQTHINRRGNGASIIRKNHQFSEYYEGEVFCPQTDDGIVYVRHPCGKAVWCGNTGEMNRHSVGTAISEGSMRYIRYEDIPYWMPKIFQGDKTFFRDDEGYALHGPFADPEWVQFRSKEHASRHEIELAFRDMEQHYARLCSIWKEELAGSAFAIKKELTSAFRRIIGMGVATGGVWSGNIRSLRHICEMRTTKHAEEEIALVAAMILRIMLDTEPQLFGDFKFDELGFAQPKYSKV